MESIARKIREHGDGREKGGEETRAEKKIHGGDGRPPKKLSRKLHKNKIFSLLLRRRAGEDHREPQPPDPRKYEAVEESEWGWLCYNTTVVEVVPKKEHKVFGELAPLFTSAKVREVVVKKTGSGCHIHISHLERGRLEVVVPSFDFNRWFRKLRVGIKVPVSRKVPMASAGYGGWRVKMKIPPATDSPEIHAVHLTSVPELHTYDPLLAARLVLLVLRPSTVLIFGRAGCGKTTFLNSLLIAMHRLFPRLRISVVEFEPELVMPENSFISRSIAAHNVSLREALVMAFTKERPDVLVLGELWDENIGTWVNVARVAALATTHGTSIEKLYYSLLDHLRAKIPTATPATLLRTVDVWVQIENYEVTAVYVSDGQRLVQTYGDGKHVPDEMFLEFLPSRVAIAGRWYKTKELYVLLKNSFGVRSVDFSLKPITLVPQPSGFEVVE